MHKGLKGAAVALALSAGLAAAPASATWVYAGSWHVGDGPVWTSNPQVLNGLETAALLFGGSAGDYAISTIDTNPANINFSAFVDGWADSQFLTVAVAQNYSLDLGGPGYNDPAGFGSAYSAWVLDHSCFNRYGNPAEKCGPDEPGLNHAFRWDGAGGVPEPATWAMMILGFGLVGAAARRRTTIAWA
jgi:hypothetical protein